MGACLDYRSYKTDDVEKAKKEFRADQETDLYENGHSYSGGIGMCEGVSNKVVKLDSEDEAIDYLDENAEKWSEALVVTYVRDGEPRVLIGGLCSC